jgi:predicted Zn-dependent protease with MMP-like domain
VNRLAPSADHTAIGLAYAKRGSRHAARRDRSRRARLALLEGQALTDLGEAGPALRRIDAALALDAGDPEAHYARGVALFELCRFAEARAVLQGVVAEHPDHAHALYHVALLDERDGEDAAATRGFAQATRLDPEAFPPAVEVSAARFAEMVRDAVAALPPDAQADLAGVPVEPAELPRLDDLTGESPPLSPTILGLFRGLPLGRDEGATPQAGRGVPRERTPTAGRGAPPARAIVLYRRNLARTVRDEAALARAVARTLEHEVGHLRGEDDGSLRDRGLE